MYAYPHKLHTYAMGMACAQVYHRMWLLEKWIEACAGNQDALDIIREHRAVMGDAGADFELPQLEGDEGQTILSLVRARWEMINTSAHCAAYCLDPEFHRHLKDGSLEGEVMEGFYKLLEKWFSDDEQGRVRAQWIDYQRGTGPFALSNKLMWEAARTVSAHMWWFEYARRAPDLRRMAMRVLTISTSAGSMERAWSTCDFIHNRRRNRLSVSRASTLVSIFSNMQIVRKVARLAAKGEDDVVIPWGWVEVEEQLEGEAEEEEMPEGEEGAIDVDASSDDGL
jgi:hypothetical protein